MFIFAVSVYFSLPMPVNFAKVHKISKYVRHTYSRKTTFEHYFRSKKNHFMLGNRKPIKQQRSLVDTKKHKTLKISCCKGTESCPENGSVSGASVINTP